MNEGIEDPTKSSEDSEDVMDIISSPNKSTDTENTSPSKKIQNNLSEVISIEDSPKKEAPIVQKTTNDIPKSADVRFIGGVKVEFPVKPYPAQVAVMDKVIKGITKSQNCLLESPTGSGKTLALLCSALAWQKQKKEAVQKQRLQRLERLVSFEAPKEPTIKKKDISPERSPIKGDAVKDPSKKIRNPYIDDTDEDDDFKSPPVSKKRQEISPCEGDSEILVNIHKRKKIIHTSPECDDCKKIPDSNTTDEFAHIESQNDEKENEIESIPKIYFGTRTHKQIDQVIRELKKTVYAEGLKMSILSSREHTCIKDLLPGFKSKIDMCRDLLDRKKRKTNAQNIKCSGCKYFDNKNKLISMFKVPRKVWDIEEFVELGSRVDSCPYFAARDIAIRADIVFCPYNYILDPLIRSSTSIETENSIILLDEAHNIEDVCREAASISIESKMLDDAIKDIEALTKLRQDYVNHEFSDLYGIRKFLMNWHDWFENHTPLLQKVSNTESSFSLNGPELSSSFSKHEIGYENYPDFKKLASEISFRLHERFDTSNESDKNQKITVSTSTGVVLESINLTFSLFFRDQNKHLDDFVGILAKKEEWEYKPQNSQGWFTKNSKTKVVSDESNLTLSMRCLNPALVFNMVETSARSVILTSGTLTPSISFPAELNAQFPIVVHTNHVITSDQVWVGSVNFGPNNIKMEATFQNTCQLEWQDSLGKLVLWICQNVPHGVLCFVSSYRLMDTLCNRWQNTGIWREIESTKSIFSESKRMKEHDEIMSDYYSSVDHGALLLAVFRGKVSEGMDFRDHQARAVIAVGIPYPNVRDSLIHNKMKYNESYKIHRGLLSGSDWLQVQAYRALNQALGRCVRHRDDWGAVIMVDSRFQNPSYTKHISKWVRNFLGDNHHSWESLTRGPNNLRKFMDRMNT